MIKKSAHVKAFKIVLLHILIVFVCGAGPCTSTPEIQIIRPPDGDNVYGIVKLTAQVSSHNGDSKAKFYYDTVDDEHLIGIDSSPIDFSYSISWYTTDVENGQHMLYAILNDTNGKSYQDSVTVNVGNLTRADTIPPDAVKMTPENDPAPPLFNPELPYLQELWEDPVPLKGPLNTAGAEDSPFITPDGNNFYFWFKGDVKMSVYEEVDDPMSGIHWSFSIVSV